MMLGIDAFFLLPAAGTLGIIFTLWLYYANRRPDLEKYPGEGRIYRCENCRLVYVERRLYPLMECPRCKHPNPAIRR